MKRFLIAGFGILAAAGMTFSALAADTKAPVYGAETETVGAAASRTPLVRVVDSSTEIVKSFSGIAGTLRQYYSAVDAGMVSAEVEETLDSMTTVKTEEDLILEAKEAALDDYSRLGVADVSGYLNVRQKASKDGKIIGKMVRHSGCEVLEETKDGKWYKIRSGSVTGYVSKDFILTGDEARAIALKEIELRVVVTSKGNLNVRQEPSTSAKIVDKVAADEHYDVEEELEGWIKIHVGVNEDNKDIYGYISSEYADVRYALLEAVEFTPVTAKTPLRTQIVNYAMKFLGNRYVFGGTSLTKGVDCSGFTMGVYGHFGYKLPHSAASQAGYGKRISASQMQPGDLIFYTYGKGRICHVAIYIGGGKIIHAANTRSGIIISRWNGSSPARIISLIKD